MARVVTEVQLELKASTECPMCGMTISASIDAFVEKAYEVIEQVLGKRLEQHTLWHKERQSLW